MAQAFPEGRVNNSTEFVIVRTTEHIAMVAESASLKKSQADSKLKIEKVKAFVELNMVGTKKQWEDLALLW